MRRLVALAVLSIHAFFAAPAAAQARWPSRPIHFIVPSAAGSGVDMVARRIGDRVSRELGQPVVVENKAGAGGAIAADFVARAPSDGHVFMVATSAPLVLSPLLSKAPRYDPAKDFAAVGRILAAPYLIVANKSVPFNTVAELIAYDKAQPGKLTFASDGIKNLGGLTGEMFNKMAGTQLLQVPYNSTARALTDTISGQTQLIFIGPQLTADAIRSGDLKALGMTTPSRTSFMPQVAPIAETLPGFEVTGWIMMVAARATPGAVIDRMNEAITRAIQEPEWVNEQQRTNGYLVANAGSPAELDRFLQDERAKWGKLITSLGIQPE